MASEHKPLETVFYYYYDLRMRISCWHFDWLSVLCLNTSWIPDFFFSGIIFSLSQPRHHYSWALQGFELHYQLWLLLLGFQSSSERMRISWNLAGAFKQCLSPLCQGSKLFSGKYLTSNHKVRSWVQISAGSRIISMYLFPAVSSEKNLFMNISSHSCWRSRSHLLWQNFHTFICFWQSSKFFSIQKACSLLTFYWISKVECSSTIRDPQ